MKRTARVISGEREIAQVREFPPDAIAIESEFPRRRDDTKIVFTSLFYRTREIVLRLAKWTIIIARARDTAAHSVFACYLPDN